MSKVKNAMLKAYNAFAPLVRSETVGTVMRKGFERSNYLVYKATGGRVWNSMGDGQIILVKTVGRKTGKVREFPLLSTKVDGRWIIVGSNAGRQTDPLWVANIRAIPEITVTVGTASSRVRAREVHDRADYERLYAGLVHVYPNYADYPKHTTRTLPLFVLDPAD